MDYRKHRWILAAFIACVTAVFLFFSTNSSKAHLALMKPSLTRKPSLVHEPSLVHKPSLVHPSQDSTSTWNPGSDWKLTWSDDFTGTTSLSDWNLATGSRGWGNGQLENYSPGNVAVEPGGGLIITASRDGYGSQCWYGACDYSSGRLDTKGLFQQAYGIFAARIKLPAGRGLWPAFWMQSANQVPYGEIDVIETSNLRPHIVSGFAHSSNINYGAYRQFPTPPSAGYHVYAIEWTPSSLSWLVDGRTYGSIALPAGAPFDQPFYLILDLAVGGVWPGPPDAATVFPAHMYVSWVHVYSQK